MDINGKIDGMKGVKVNTPDSVPILLNHDPLNIIGKCKTEFKNGHLVIDGEIVKPIEWFELDVGYQVVEKEGDSIKEVNLIEVSLLDFTNNQ